jgi:hypothetical protein
MQDLTITQRTAALGPSTVEAKTSAVTWAAILAGAVVAAAVSLILVLLATGMDLASMSPWPSSGASATSMVVMTAIAVLIIQWLSAAVGGYVTGRLRTKWVGTHTHEVFFRDTAHGFIAWAVATLLVTSALASGASSLLGAGARASGMAAATLASNASSGGTTSDVRPYDLDMLFRTSAGTEARPGASGAREETGHILARGLVTGDVSAADRTYLAQLIAAQAGVSDADAQRRVDEGITQMKAAADAARRSSEMTAIFAALAMVVGAFIACVSAALGGRVRDMHP